MEPYQIVIIIVVIIALGVAVLPAFNRWQFKRLPYDQQVLTIMRQAKGLIYWKNISHGRTGSLFYVKNKRKILVYPWVIDENGRMVIQKENPFDCWDYPAEHPPLNEDEIKQAREELKKYSRKSAVKFVVNDPFENGDAQQKPQQ